MSMISQNSKVNRREFLAKSAFAGLGLAFAAGNTLAIGNSFLKNKDVTGQGTTGSSNTFSTPLGMVRAKKIRLNLSGRLTKKGLDFLILPKFTVPISANNLRVKL